MLAVVTKREQQDAGDRANRIIAFFEGTPFKILAGLLALGGIAIALFSGGIPDSRVPAPNEQVRVQPQPGAASNQSPASRPAQSAGDDRGGSARKRFDAYQERGN